MLDMNHDNKIDSRDHYLFNQAAGDNEKRHPGGILQNCQEIKYGGTKAVR